MRLIMNYWPDGMAVDPIGEWPGVLTPNRSRSNFSASWSQTLAVLTRETEALSGREVRLQVAIPANQFRLDGRPRATAKAEHPGVILTLDSRHGALSYPCDTFDRWQDNVRAIALALEALRKVDRYGVTKRGEQYRGFLSLEATSAPAGFADADAALDFLQTLVGDQFPRGSIPRVRGVAVARVVRGAQRRTHPDHGGDPTVFQRVSLAEAKLREAGLL